MSEQLKKLDYSVLQQCMHCGMCLPTCPTYSATKIEKHSPRGRISLMRAIADDRLEVSPEFGREMYFCLGCLACETACPAGVDYTHLFETARAEVEESHVLSHPRRDWIRWLTLNFLFLRPRLLRFVGRLLGIYQQSGLQTLVRRSGLLRLLSNRWQNLEKQTPVVQAHFSPSLIQPVERPKQIRFRVVLLTGCVQDLLYSHINRDTVSVLLRHGCEVLTPAIQNCCGSLHAHNGELAPAKELARKNIEAVDLPHIDAIISNAAGCGSHLKHYDRLLADDPRYAQRAQEWSRKLKDIHEWLVEIGLQMPTAAKDSGTHREKVTYHEACHLCHGQKITEPPRAILRALPGFELIELPESTWCCGSAGIYNLTQPDMAADLQRRKVRHILSTQASTVATGNPGCLLQLFNGLQTHSPSVRVVHPITLLAEAYQREEQQKKR